jgi:tetratricopeptide (TPR) repeat protein
MPRQDTPAGTLLARAARFMREGRVAEALAPLRMAAALQPGDATVQHDLGCVLLQSGRLAEATAAFGAALAARPRFALASLRLGIALQAQGDEAAALAAYRQTTALQPSLAEARHRAALLLQSHGRHDEAVDAFRRAAASAPRTGLGRLCAARALLAEGRDAEARRSLLQLLALEPGHAAATDLLGLVHADAGRLEEARDCYDRATAASPALAGSYYDLARCRRITPADAALLARMRAALADPVLHPEARLKVHLAVGKACDDLADYGRAMQHFDEADTLRAGLGSFDLGAFEARVDRLIAHFTPDRLAGAARGGSCDPGRDDLAAVLVVGLPRSGTTLVEQILSCHPAVGAGGEMPFWSGRGALWEQRGAAGGDEDFLAEAASEYTDLLRALAPRAARVTDKMPLNVFWAGLVHMALPRATILYCRRSPIDTALSIHRTYFNQHAAFPTGGAALVATVRAVGRLAAHWHSVLPPERFVEVEYERLVGDPVLEIRRLVAACGLPWDESCLFPEHNPRIVRTPSKWQVRKPISRDATDAWRRYEPWLGPLAALVP